MAPLFGNNYKQMIKESTRLVDKLGNEHDELTRFMLLFIDAQSKFGRELENIRDKSDLLLDKAKTNFQVAYTSAKLGAHVVQNLYRFIKQTKKSNPFDRYKLLTINTCQCYKSPKSKVQSQDWTWTTLPHHKLFKHFQALPFWKPLMTHIIDPNSKAKNLQIFFATPQ